MHTSAMAWITHPTDGFHGTLMVWACVERNVAGRVNKFPETYKHQKVDENLKLWLSGRIKMIYF